MSDAKLTMIKLKNRGGLIPHGDVAWDVYDKIPIHKPVVVSVHAVRNPEHLEKFWSLAGRVADFSPDFIDDKAAVRFAKWRLGMFKTYHMKDGSIWGELDSISYESMDQTQFNEFYDKCLAVWAEEIDCDPEELRDDGT